MIRPKSTRPVWRLSLCTWSYKCRTRIVTRYLRSISTFLLKRIIGSLFFRLVLDTINYSATRVTSFMLWSTAAYNFVHFGHLMAFRFHFILIVLQIHREDLQRVIYRRRLSKYWIYSIDKQIKDKVRTFPGTQASKRGSISDFIWEIFNSDLCLDTDYPGSF